MACRSARPVMPGYSGKKVIFSLFICGMLLTLSGCAAGNADAFPYSYKEEASACVFNGDSVEAIEEMESPIVDEWPESLSCVSNGMTAEPYSVSISIDEPMELSVSCIREEGKIDMRITDADGKVAFYAKAWYGKITIKPSE